MRITEKKKVIFRRISTVSLIYHTMRAKVSKHLRQNFAGFFHNIRDFAQIFDKSKLMGKYLYPPASLPPTPLSKLASRSTIETPLLLFMVLNTGPQQSSWKLVCSTPVKKSKNCQIMLILQMLIPATIYKFFMHANVGSTAVCAASSSTILGGWCAVTSNEKSN